MNRILTLLLLGGLAACSSSTETATFACPNGPNLAVVYTDDTAILTLPGGRTEALPKSSDSVYAKPGIVWQIVAFRTARLTDGSKSYHCDQSSV